ncbi:hypothetical protein TNCV_998021 [Trichonephila clavipes]|nr:hypothetical protein TNCV_998021 [Trichonephila clavipes]
MVLKANDRRTSCPCHDEFRGPRSDYVRQVALATTKTTTTLEQFENEYALFLFHFDTADYDHSVKNGHGQRYRSHRTTVPSVITAYLNLGKVSSVKHNGGRMSMLKGRSRRMLEKIVAQKCKATLQQIMSETNTYLQSPVSMKILQRELRGANTFMTE